MIQQPGKLNLGELSVLNQRITLLACVFLIILFIPGDLLLIPKNLSSTYLVSRLALQIPILLLLIVLSFTSLFSKHRDLLLLVALTCLIYSNFWLIYSCWVTSKYSFPYEGTMLYGFFGIIVLRLRLIYSILLAFLIITGFACLVFTLGVYEERYLHNFGFVSGSQLIALLSSYALWRSFSYSEKLNILSKTDQLTGLLNRRAYESEGQLLLDIAIREQQPFSVFLLDIDEFKKYNDTYGHQFGDRVLQKQSNILNFVFQRQTDLKGRYGGEEFLVISANMDSNLAVSMGNEILSAWDIHRIEHSAALTAKYVTCSVGIVSMVPTKGMSLQELIMLADRELYKAKNAGKNCISVNTDKN